jgi:16S rRNA (adenine1518-N6/adenine1519-N6)-dimethyltransferase
MRNTQIFLRDPNVLRAIIERAAITKTDIVIEIGSGDGRLTKEIASRAKKVYAIERDLNLLDTSKMNLAEFDNVEFVHGDALEVDFPESANKIVSNLPYAISSPITTKIVYFLNAHRGSVAILMYQKEFAERMLAIPGIRDYSMLTVFSQYTSDIKKLMNVNKKCFRPTPSVDSVVLEVKPKNIEINKGFLSFCRVIFQHKKKNFYSALLDSREKMAVHSKEEIRERLKGINEDILKRKVFFFEIDELLDIYNKILKVGIWR